MMPYHNFTYLEVNYNSKDKYGGNEVHKVGKVLTVEGFPQSSDFICTSSQQME